MQFKQVSHEIKELDDAKGVVIAYASVYNNLDSDNEIIAPGAFTKTVNENFKRIRVLKDHNPTISLGVPLSIDTNDYFTYDGTTGKYTCKKDCIILFEFVYRALITSGGINNYIQI